MQDNSILEFSRVTKSYAETGNAIDSITMNIERSTFCYLTGHSGAGKSTLLKLIVGMEKPNTGILLFNKRNVSSITPSQLQQLRRKIGFVFQQPKLIEYLTVHDNVAIALQSSGYTKHDIQDRAYAALRLVQLDHRAKSMPNALSGGEQQRVSIARAVANLPSLILADEPTGNLDEQLKRNILELFAKIHQNKCTVLLATHDISLMRHYPGRHISLSKGKIQIDSTTQLQT
ncbi:MAG: ATP-binding cassette domain-containing protein [Methylacidiphilales bacterium]|nr:ATP-binding cassette domain-containing protein [Candidatus Methylacidiphilales bacterium]